jgi:hydroxyacyl-ACP dehydratase HTD2-like protein with hotdog domain
VVTRGAPRWVEGRFGRALFCDETGDQLTVEGLSFGAQSGASLGLWLKMPRRIISGGMLRFERALTLKGYWNSHGELELSFDQGPKTEAIRPRGQRLDDDAWHHVALVKDGTQASLFVDGRPVLTLPGLPATLNTTRLILGGQAQAYDELALFNRALTAAQVQALTTRAVTAVEPGLAHAWSFDEAEAVAREAAPR